MIGTFQLGEFLEDLSVVGTQSTGKKVAILIPVPCVLKSVLARLGTAGITGTQNIDLQKNGTTIFASGAAAIQFATTSATPTYGAFATPNPMTFVKGDILVVNVTTVHSGTAAVDLGLVIVLQRPRGTHLAAATVTDSIGD